MTLNEIREYFNQFNFDLRVSHDARWIDQKCTPDVVCFMADCVLNYLSENPTATSFTVNDIWDSAYFDENVQGVFGKPTAENPNADNEYDKFINQPLKMLSYAHILSCTKRGNANQFTIVNNEILEYLATRERNTYQFLVIYITKVLADSGLLPIFETFFERCRLNTVTNSHFVELKNSYEDFILEHTPINQRVEIRRIFTKVINPLSVDRTSRGTIRGRLSPNIITYSDLMYNRVNWRDTLKAKGLTRQEFEDATAGNEEAQEYTNYLIQKAMNQIKRRYRTSELFDDWAMGDATQVHHIFMKSDFPQIAYYLENLIKLTPTQHYTKAHPNNNTHVIDSTYQYNCLIAKSHSIQLALERNEDFYSVENFVYVVNTGLNSNLDANSSLDSARRFLATAYNTN